MRLGGFESPAFLRVEEGDVGEVAALEGAAAAKVEDPGGSGGEEFDDAGKRNFVLSVQLCDGQGQRGFETGDAE